MKLKELNEKKYLNDLKYWDEEFSIKKSMMELIEDYFNKELNVYLENNNEMKILWEKRFNSIIIKEERENIDIKENKKEINNSVKKLYRNIVKNTHPDKTNNDILNDFYKKSKIYYDNNDILGLMKISNELNLNININFDIEYLKNEIEVLKQKTSLIENSFYWKWYNVEDDKKENILKEFLIKKLRI